MTLTIKQNPAQSFPANILGLDAVSIKQEGENLFKRDDFTGALNSFSEALEIDPPGIKPL
jgi:hypothetical protein